MQMSDINIIYMQAHLALAAYGNFNPGAVPSTDELQRIGMTETQAVQFAQNWFVVDQYNDPNGLSVTVFENSNKRYLAIRGTDFSLLDLTADYILANGFPADLNFQFASLKTKIQEWTNNGVLPTVFTVAGHSLGGYLADAVGLEYGARVQTIYTYNAPGVDGGLNSVVDYLREALGITNSGTLNNLYNLRATSGYSLVANLGRQLAPPIFIETEFSLNPLANHSVIPLTDSLALYDLFARIDPLLNTTDPAVGIGKITDILKASSAQAASSLERTADALANFFGSGFAPVTGNQMDNREALYQRVLSLQTTIANLTANSTLVVDSLVNIAAADLANLAQGSTAFAYRYALREVNPFAVVGDNNLYAPHNANGELDLYSVADRSGTLTAGWITDRANLLYAEIIRNTQDNPGLARLPESGDHVTEYHHYRSGKEEVFFAQPADSSTGQLPTEVVMFADDAGRLLTGTDNLRGDRLYGGGDTDYLSGKGNDDSLEGGRGLDIYQYNASSGTSGPPNDGADVIRDTDGKGVLRYTYTQSGFFSNTVQSTVIADASVRVSGLQWNSADGKFSYIRSQNDLIVTINDGGGSITLKDFRDGDFYIHLWEARINPDITGVTLTGDLQPQDFDPNTDGIQTQTNELGNVIVTTNPEPDRNDVLNDSTGNDRIIARGGNDILRGIRGGDDWMSGGAGRDNLAGGAGLDLIEGGVDGVFEGESGGDIAFGDVGGDELYADTKIALAQAITQGNTGTGGNAKGEYLSGGGEDDWIVGAGGDDYLDGGSGQDLIVGGAGDDNLTGDYGFVATTPLWVIAREIIPQDNSTLHRLNFVSGSVSGLDFGAGAADVVYAGSGADWVAAGDGDDFADGGPGDDKTWGEAGSDVLIGGADNDLLVGDNPTIITGAAEGADYLDGGAGDDQLEGDGGGDVLIGGTGRDTLSGGTGKDIYVFNKGDGTETVFDDDTDPNNPDASVLVLGDNINPSAIKFRTGSLAVDLGPSDPADPNSPHDVIHFNGFNQIDPLASMPLAEIRFGDGMGMSYTDILAQGFDIDGTEGDDTGVQNLVGTGVTDRIQGFGGNDLLFGFRGDDMLDGGDGADQILGGPGVDTIYGGSEHDEIWGDAESGGIFAPDGNDVIYAGAGDDIVEGNGGGDEIFGDDGSDTLYGDDEADVLDGGADNDFLYGQGYFFVGGIPFLNLFDDGAADTLRGGDGNDYLNAAAGDDVLEGGAGDDNLEGEAGADYLAGVDGNDLLWGDKADAPVADQGNDTLDGGAGNDQLTGYAGNDTYVFGRGYGQDIIFDQDSTPVNVDVVEFAADITPDDVTAELSAPSLVLTINGTTDRLTVANQYFSSADQVEEIRFADGTVWTFTTTPLLIRGTVGNNVLNGTSGPDIFEGLSGNDIMSGGAGNDTYHIFRGDGQDTITDSDATAGNVDKIVYASDILPAAIQAVRSGSNLVLRLTGTIDQVTVTNYFANDGVTPNSVEQIKFLADGTIWNVNTVKQVVLTGTDSAETIIGYATNDTLTGLGGNDNLIANAGDDTLDGGAGNDQLNGGTGNDTYLVARGDGQDLIFDVDDTAGNVDRLVYAADILPSEIQVTRDGALLEWNHLVLKLAGTTDFLRIGDYFRNDGVNSSLVEQVQFAADGTTWDVAAIKLLALTGTSANDTIVGYATDDFLNGLGGDDSHYGGAGNDTFDGGIGSDYMEGGGGDDEYRIYRGSGTDRIFDSIGTDKVVYAADILPSQVQVTRDPSSLLTVLHLAGTSDFLLLDNQYDQNPPWVIDQIQFLADGTVWDVDTVKTMLITPTSGSDNIVGYATNDSLSGLAGDDFIYGDVGNDTLDGGTGNDVLYGEEGSDTYLFGLGYGADDIYNHLPGFSPHLDSFGSIDVLQFAAGIAPSQVSTSKSEDDLILQISGTADRIAIRNYFLSGLATVEEIRFSDGTVWTEQAITLMFPVNGTAANDNIQGTSLSEVVNGLAGNDTLRGGAGNDTIDGGLGSDQLFGDDGNDLLIAGNGDQKNAKVSNTLRGGLGDDVLVASGNFLDSLFGETGNDILLGGGNRDSLQDTAGNNLMVGGATSDFIDMGDQNDLVIGGTGDEFIDGDNSNINGIRGREILSFNKGDGNDFVSRLGPASTISLGGGVLYSNLSLVAGSGLQLKVGNNSISLNGWYDTPGEKSVTTLQIVIEGTRDYKPTSTNPMNNQKIQAFDFLGLVAAFDAARAAGKRFNVADNLANFRLWSSDTEAIGGAVAYQYARTGTLDALSYDQMRAVISDPAFADSAQSINSPAGTALATETTTASLADTFFAIAVAEESSTSKNEDSRLSADTEVITDQQANTFTPETESPNPEGDETTSPNTEMVSADDVVSRVPVEHVIAPTPVLPSLSSSAPGAQLASRGSQHSAGITPRISEARDAKPTLPGLVTDDSPAASGSMGDRGEAVHAAHSGVSSAGRETSTGTNDLIEEWFVRHPWNDDLPLLDEISRGESGVGAPGGNNASMAADWRRSHAWLNGRLHSSIGDGETDGDGVYLDAQSFLGDTSTLFDPPQAAVGLRNVAGHSLESFSGLREGMNILSQS
jgi:Ca2+-binding RTX toxin-like protein